jgi:AbiJ-like protein
MDRELGKDIARLGQCVVANFNLGNWREVGLLTGQADVINEYPRLLRSLDWGDPDYAGNVLGVLRHIAETDQRAFREFEQYVNERFPDKSEEYVSSKPAPRRITFAPNVFEVRACKSAGFRSLRADDIWEESVIVQDIFNLVYRSQIVVVDFTGKNPNVMYETGIAHTLGKHVFPISQSLDDVPFDLTHHRILKYLNNAEGLLQLETKLGARLRHVSPASSDDDEGVPF